MKNEKQKSIIILRGMKHSDCAEIGEAFKLQGWYKPTSQFMKYLMYQDKGIRDVIVAELNGKFAGYLTINWESDYAPFRRKRIPEIVDFNVLKKFQRLGIGTKLMDEAERRIKSVSTYAGISFGLTQDYGAAQILYINRNYKPDGNGIVKNSAPVKHGERITINDDIVFCLTKKLD